MHGVQICLQPRLTSLEMRVRWTIDPQQLRQVFRNVIGARNASLRIFDCETECRGGWRFPVPGGGYPCHIGETV